MAVEGYLREPEPGDVTELLINMRPVDVDEVRAAFGDCNFEDMIIDGVSTSYKPGAAVGHDGKLWCLFGVIPVGSALTNTGLIWLLGTHEFDRHPVGFTQLARGYIDHVRQTRFPVLTNYVDARNRKTIRWLKALGFKMDLTVAYGVQQLPFHRFHIGLKEQCALLLSL